MSNRKGNAIDKIVEAKKTLDSDKGIMRYALSDREFIDKGWTMLPTEKVVRKMNIYRMRPAKPEFDWFEHNKSKKFMSYDSGERLAEIDENGKGRWYYRNGQVALTYTDAEEPHVEQRVVVFSSGEPDHRGRSGSTTVLASFDHMGNGVVFDHGGKIRLKYNQTEGVVLDREIGPVTTWKWHSLNDPPVLQQVMIDTYMAHKDPDLYKIPEPRNDRHQVQEDMLAIEYDNFIKEKNKKMAQSFKPFQIRMKALKINEYFSLKVLDQATVYLMYRDGLTSLKLNLGMILEHQEIIDTETAELGEVSQPLERTPARSTSVGELQHGLNVTRADERARTLRECRLRMPLPAYSTDRFTAACSHPPRSPPPSALPNPGFCNTPERCNRKPNGPHYYYSTRFM